MKYAVILAALLLTACVHQEPQAPVRDLSVVQQECGMTNKPFPAAWPCVRTEVANLGGGGGGEGSDIRDLYVATGDYISEQVSTGKMTDAQARLALAEARTRAKSAIDSRIAATTPAYVPRAPRVFSRSGSSGNTEPPQTTIIGTPRGGVICQRTSPISVYCS